jgi:hypothetical protein
MFLDDKHYEGDEDEAPLGQHVAPPPAPPPPPKPPSTSLGNVYVGGCVALIVLLVFVKKQELRAPMLGIAFVLVIVYLAYRSLTRPDRQIDPNAPYDPVMRDLDNSWRSTKDNVLFSVVGGIFRGLLYLFTGGNKD